MLKYEIQNKYLWKLLFTRDYKININKSHNDLYILYNYLIKGTYNFNYMECKFIEYPKLFDKIRLFNLRKIVYYKIFPNEITSLLTLKSIILKGYHWHYLPTEIGILVNLNFFHIYENDLYNIPSQIGSLINLKSFSVVSNKLHSFPQEMGLLINLKELTIWGDSLLIYPHEMKLLNLRIINLSNNYLNRM